MSTENQAGTAGWQPPSHMHVGRNWTGHRTEDECPCPKAPCGLVDRDETDPECTQHPFGRTKTMRQGHTADLCPGIAKQAPDTEAVQ